MASERIQKILTLVNNRVQQLMEVDRFYVALYDPVRMKLEFPLVVDNGDLAETSQTPWTTRPYQGRMLPDRVIDQKEPLLFEHDWTKVTEEAGVEYWPGDGHPLSWLGVPMIFEEQLIGVLVAENRNKVGAFGERGRSVLSTVARQAAIAIENARLYERLERQVTSLSALNEIGQQLTAGIRLSEPEVLELIYQQASQVMDTNNMYIALYDEETDTTWFALALLHGRRVDVATEEGWQPRSGGQGRTEWIIRHREPLVSSTWAETEEWYKQTGHINYVRQPFASWIGVPMIAGEKVLGIIATYNTQEYAYDEDHLQVLSSIASQAAIALDNARLYENLEERVRERTQQLAALQEIGVTITSQLDLEEVLGSIAENANVVMSADFTTLFPYDAGQGKFERGIRKGEIEVVPSTPSNTGFSTSIAQTQKAVFAEDAEKHPSVKLTFIRNKGVKSFAGVPLVVRGRTVGILYVNFLETHSFAQEEKETIGLLANQAAVAIENARLYHELERKIEELEQAQSEIANKERALVLTSIAADFVHRMNNLAGTIPNWVGLIKRLLRLTGGGDKRVLQYLDRISIETKVLLQEARRLRDPLAKPEKVDIDKLARSIIAQIKFITEPKIQISYESDMDQVYVLGAKSQLSDALFNVIDNAVKSISGEGQVAVKLRKDANQPERFIHIEISDTGIGIPQDKLAKIFELGTSYRSGGEGMGYGLWRTKNIVEGLGGDVHASSTMGKGTTFRITLLIMSLDQETNQEDFA